MRLATWAALLAAVAPGSARAQSCCSTTGGDEFGVVPECNYAVVASQLSYEHAIGSFGSDARYRSLSNASSGETCDHF